MTEYVTLWHLKGRVVGRINGRLDYGICIRNKHLSLILFNSLKIIVNEKYLSTFAGKNTIHYHI